MALASELAVLIIYAVQQIGIVLAVGAETVLLVFYLTSVGRNIRFTHPHARTAQYIGLALVILSGIGAVVLHFSEAQLSILLAPAFIFKWLLIFLLAVCTIIRPEERARGWVAYSAAGLEGATWYALFVVHVVAPITTWMYLGAGYIAWALLFTVVWSGFVYLMIPKIMKERPVQQKVAPVLQKLEPKSVSVAPPPVHHEAAPAPHKPVPEKQPVVVAPLPALVYAELEAPHPMPAPAPIHHIPAPAPTPVAAKPVAPVIAPVPQHPAPAPAPKMPESIFDELPAIRVMPRTPQELKDQDQGSIVKFS